MNFWDRLYATERFRYGVDPNDFVAESVEELLRKGLDPASSSAVDVAAGEGRNAVFLAEQGFTTVAIDQSEVGLEKTLGLARSRKVQLEAVRSDLFHWKPEKTFDLVVSTFLHVREPGQQAVLRRLEALTTPGGYILAEFFHPEQRLSGLRSGGPPEPEMMVTPELVEETLSDSELLINRSLHRELREGKGHRGLGVVTQLLAVRR
jgi:ubiquinone/menaquinone biosynthesis C-methylase UbiE